MSNEILIPVRRRHAATRADLELMVTKPQHWGYAENEDLLLARRISGARRYFSRSALCRPGTTYDPVANVDTSNRVGINCTPNTEWDTGASSILELNGTTNSSLATIGHDFYLFNGTVRKTDAKYYRLNAIQYPKMFTGIANSWSFYVGATGAADSELVTTAVTTYNSYFGTGGTRINVNNGAFDFQVSTIASANSLNINGTTGNVGLGTAPHASAAIDIIGNSHGETAQWQMRIAGKEAYDTLPNSGILFMNKYLIVGTYAAMAGIIGGKESGAEDFAGYLGFYTRSIGVPISEKARISSEGNFGLGTTSFNAVAKTCFAIANGTAPNAHDDNQIYIYSQDAVDVAAATLALYTERAVEATLDIPVTHYLEVILNGTHYAILLNDLVPLGP
jgi:hypothetical protein